MMMRRLILYIAVSVVWLQTVVHTEDETVNDSCFYKDSGEWSECSPDTHVQTIKQVFIVGEFSCPTSKLKTRACSIGGVESTTAGNDTVFEEPPRIDLDSAKENTVKGKGDLGEGEGQGNNDGVEQPQVDDYGGGEGQGNNNGVEQPQVDDYGGGEGQGNNNGVEQPLVRGQDVGKGKTEGVRGAGGHEARMTPLGGGRSQLKVNDVTRQWRKDYSGGGGGSVHPDGRHVGWQNQRGPHHPPQGQSGPPHQPQGQSGPPHQPQGQWGPPHPPQGQWGPPHPPQGQWGPPHPPHGQWGQTRHGPWGGRPHPPHGPRGGHHHPSHGQWGPPNHQHGQRGTQWQGQGYGGRRWGPGRPWKRFMRKMWKKKTEGQTKQQMKNYMEG